MSFFDFFRRKEKKIPSGIFFTGMQGVGKSSLATNLHKLLSIYGYEIVFEKHKKYRGEIINNSKIKELILTSKSFISDTLPFHSSYIDNIFNIIETYKFEELDNLWINMVNNFEKEILKTQKIDLSNYLIVLIKNERGGEFFAKREGMECDKENYNIFKTIYEKNIIKFGEYFISKGGKFIELAVSNLDINDESVVKKILEEKLLF